MLQERAADLLLSSELPTAATFLRVSTINFLKADEVSGVDTAAMSFNPRTGKAKIEFNVPFVTQYAYTPLRFAALEMHELMHHMLHHYVLYPYDRVTNIAQDALINALICRLASNFQQLFTDLYSKNLFPWMILRPGANFKRIEYTPIREHVAGVYKRLYRRYNRSLGRYFMNGGGVDEDVFTVDDMRTFFTIAAQMQRDEMEHNRSLGMDPMHGLGGLDPYWCEEEIPLSQILLGNHDEDQAQDDLDESTLDEEFKGDIGGLLDGLTDELSSNPNARGLFRQGFGIVKDEDSPDELLEAMEKGLREEIMRCKEIVETVIGTRLSRTGVIPRHIGRKELALLGGGITPLFWPQFGPDEKPDGDVIIYIDVSGSMGNQAPFLLMLMTNFKEQIETEFYQFSTEIAATPFHDFVTHFEQTGEVYVQTTGGTDFDPIFVHADEHNYRKIVIITDGEAGLSPEAQMLARGIKTYVVFTDNHNDQPLTDIAEQTWVMPRLKKPKKDVA